MPKEIIRCICCGEPADPSPEIRRGLKTGKYSWVAHVGEFVELAARREPTGEEAKAWSGKGSWLG